MPESAKIQFTPAQSAAITARGGSLLVSAAAGSGKTRVLVERVVGLITDPIHPVEADSLLIMTFTNAAAAKLRADITTRLAEEVRAHPGDMRLRRQQLLLQRAAIGTVDAFCLHFVQQHFAALDVPPDFTTAEEAELARIEQETLSAVLESAYTDADFRAFADLYDRGRTDNTAGNAVLELYHFCRALPHPAEVLQQFAAMWQQDTPPQDTPWGQNLLAISLQRAQGARALLQAAARTAAKDEAADFAYTAVLQEDADRVTWLCQVLEKGDWDRSVAALGEFDTAWRRAGRIKGGKDGNPCAFAASELRARAKKQIESLRTDFLLCTGEEYAADRRRAAPLVAALVRVTQQFADACFAAKCEEKLLDYADFEHLTLDLLLTPDNQRTPLCRTVSSHYSAVLVDEYQDTNALQDAIYFALARSEGDNLFFVGDIKQSIYRFRQADPQVFVDKQQRWQAYPQPAPQPASLALDANFRSAPGVIAGINYLFEVFFSQGLGGFCWAHRPAGGYPRHGCRPAKRRPDPKHRRSDPAGLRQHHDGAPLQRVGVPGGLCGQHLPPVQPERRHPPSADPQQAGRGRHAAGGQHRQAVQNATLRRAGPGHPHRNAERGDARFVRGADPCPGCADYHDTAEKGSQLAENTRPLRPRRGHRPRSHAGHVQLGGLAADRRAAAPQQ